MKATGIIVEYNPFHNGHLLHLQEARKQTDADVVIAVMSGSFLQRGEPALLPKWGRAQMAVDAGVDLVVELPFDYATQQAAIFAHGAIEILGSLGVSSVFFGSENGDAKVFSSIAKLVTEESVSFKASIRRFLDDKANSYATAWNNAIRELAPDLTLDLAQPNNILGFHYALAIAEQGKNINIATMSRKSAGYHDQSPAHHSIASATAIRHILLANDWKTAQQYLPDTTFAILQKYRETHSFVTWNDFWPLLRYQLISAPTDQLATIRGVSEGIENRLQQAAIHAATFDDFLAKTTTKRYSTSRIKRTALQILFQQRAHDTASQNYIRLLGMSANGQQYLSQIKKEISLPIVSTASKANPHLIQNDIRAGKLYSLAPSLGDQVLRDFHTTPYRKKP
ncbi:nucleotidyltransferase [Listeria weihenstephanensis]|uniref:tRNA(Met) cytidine acetate ligase n=1 Tax=Listeria weihenstephanensis TaxID=1006155 RepID=A0A841Z4F3_9LIST|nr:nucleotidyltransferase [Listeria weihenstephanensis]MBC1499552.1 nucleotidyltransferase [Listeria weihenstephanensis]